LIIELPFAAVVLLLWETTRESGSVLPEPCKVRNPAWLSHFFINNCSVIIRCWL
jgi:hypothetical protein